MNLKLIFFIGVFCNIMMAMIFPYQLLPTDIAASLISSDEIGYTINDDTFGTNSKTSTSELYTTVNDNTATEGLVDLNTQEVSFLDTISNFFDGLFDGLTKLKTYFLLILPFGTILGLLPGAIGIVLQFLYSAMGIYAIIQFIRSG